MGAAAPETIGANVVEHVAADAAELPFIKPPALHEIPGKIFNWIGTKLDFSRFRHYDITNGLPGGDVLAESQARLTRIVTEQLTWLMLAGTLIVLVAGDNEAPDARCWEPVIGSENVEKLDERKRRLCEQHGMLLQDVLDYCTPYKLSRSDAVVVKNSLGEYYAFAITAKSPAGSSKASPNDKYDVFVVHAVPVEISQ